MSDYRLVWYPPNGGDAITFTDEPRATFKILLTQGLGEALTSPVTQKGPGQVGETLIDSLISPRVLALSVAVIASSRAEYWTLRQQLAGAFAVSPTRFGGTPGKGQLWFYRDDFDTPLFIEAVPRNSPQLQPQGPLAAFSDIELVAAFPYWREVEQRSSTLSEGGGFEFPIEHPFEMASFNQEVDVDNVGTADASVLMTIYGDCETARLINETTGETIEITGAIAADERVEIETAYGQKAVTLVDSLEVRTNIFDRVNLALSDFWQLRPGLNRIRFEADVNTSGSAALSWRATYAGV